MTEDSYTDEWRELTRIVAEDKQLFQEIMAQFAMVCYKKSLYWSTTPPLNPEFTNGLNTVNNPSRIFQSLGDTATNSFSYAHRQLRFSILVAFMDTTKSLNTKRLPLAGLTRDKIPENYSYRRLYRDARSLLLALIERCNKARG